MEHEQVVQIQIRPSMLQVGVAVGATIALLGAGFALGRVTAGSGVDSVGVTVQERAVESAGDLQTTNSTSTSTTLGPLASVPTEADVVSDEGQPGSEGDALQGSSAEDLQTALEEVSIHQIAFVPGSEQLSPSSLVSVSELAEVLTTHPLIPVELAITTITEESAGQNHGLSTQQAAALAGALFSQGVDPARFVAVGVGSGSHGHASGGAGAADGDHADGGAVAVLVGPRAAAALAVAQIDTRVIDFKVHTGVMMPGSEVAIEQLAEAMNLDPSTRVEIAAHTYSERSSFLNHELSHVQGEEVVAVLTDELRVGRERLDFIGHGDPAHFAESGRNSFITFTVVR